MPYAHSWGSPHVAMLANRVAVPRQACTSCHTERNPVTRQIAWYGRGFSCWTNSTAAVPPEPDHSDQLARVRSDLEALKASGTPVDLYHAEPQPRRAPDLRRNG